MTRVDLPPDSAAAADAVTAAEFAAAAGRLLIDLRRDDADPDALRRQGDRRSHELLSALLAERFPDDAVLSEEGGDSADRLTARRVWIVDPLDGTREYGEPGRTDWAVHVALVEDGALVAGAVALPALGITCSSHDHPDPLSAPVPAIPRILVSRTRRPDPVLRIADALGGELGRRQGDGRRPR